MKTEVQCPRCNRGDIAPGDSFCRSCSAPLSDAAKRGEMLDAVAGFTFLMSAPFFAAGIAQWFLGDDWFRGTLDNPVRSWSIALMAVGLVIVIGGVAVYWSLKSRMTRHPE